MACRATRLPYKDLGGHVGVLVSAAVLDQRLARNRLEVVGVALGLRMMDALLLGQGQMAATAVAILQLVLLQAFERFRLLELLDELHVVLERVDLARVAALSDA